MSNERNDSASSESADSPENTGDTPIIITGGVASSASAESSDSANRGETPEQLETQE